MANQQSDSAQSFGAGRHAPWHFLVDLGGGVFTIPREQWESHTHAIIAQDYVSRSVLPMFCRLLQTETAKAAVLDVGCNEGWLSIVLAKMGYAKVIGIDPDPYNIEKANFLKNHFGLANIEFVQAGIHEIPPGPSFNAAFCLGVLNHVNDSIGALSRLRERVSEFLVLDMDIKCRDSVPIAPSQGHATRFADQGAMTLGIEGYHQTTSPDDNLVMQYSNRAVELLLYKAGFSPVLNMALPIAAPYHYRTSRRSLYFAFTDREDVFNAQCLLDDSYERFLRDSRCALPELLEEGVCGYNIVRFMGAYYGVPQGLADSFDPVALLMDERCAVSGNIQSLRACVAAAAGGVQSFGASLVDERTGIAFNLCSDLLLQQRLQEAECLLAHFGPYAETQGGALGSKWQVLRGKLLYRSGRDSEARQCFQHAQSLNSANREALALLRQFDHGAGIPSSHDLFKV